MRPDLVDSDALRAWVDRAKGGDRQARDLALAFEGFGAALLDGLADEPDADPLMAEEVKRGCTLAMLTCLDREHRLAYILGDVFDLSPSAAASLCAVTEAAYRQRLSRARRALEAFTDSFCGLVNGAAPCLCSKRVARAVELGRVERHRPQLARVVVDRSQQEMESLHGTARLMREHPAYSAPAQLLGDVRAIVDRGLSLLQ